MDIEIASGNLQSDMTAWMDLIGRINILKILSSINLLTNQWFKLIDEYFLSHPLEDGKGFKTPSTPDTYNAWHQLANGRSLADPSSRMCLSLLWLISCALP